jgi:hypothetical protein
MPICANCDEWFEGQEKNQALCEHCGQLNPLEIIANPEEDPDSWVCREYFEIKANLFRLKAMMLLPVAAAFAATAWWNLQILGMVLIGVTVVLMLLVWGLKWALLVASENGETHLFRMLTCYGFVVFERERPPEKTGPVIVQLVNSIDPETNVAVHRRLIRLDRFTVTGFDSRDGGLRFARLLADHCGLEVQRLLGA